MSTSVIFDNKMSISIIIPVYNAEKYLRKAVDSAIAQPEVDEIVLVEDKSPDNALALCQELVKEHDIIKLYQHPDKGNHGAGASRNLGIKKASCDYIAFLDADDYYLPDRFKKDFEVFNKIPDCDGTYGALGRYNYNTNQLDFDNLTRLKKKLPPNQLFSALIGMNNEFYGYFHLNTLTIKKEVFKKTGYFNTNLKLHQDMNFIIKLAYCCNLICTSTNKAYAVRGMHNDNRVSNKTNFNYFRPYLYLDVYKWGVQNRMPKKFLRQLYNNFTLYKLTNKKIFHIIWHFVLYPFLHKNINHPLFGFLVKKLFKNSCISYLLFGLRNRLLLLNKS